MKIIGKFVLASAVIVVSSAALCAQVSAGATGDRGVSATLQVGVGTGIKVTEAAPGLLAKAKVKPEAAMASAQAKVPKGALTTAEIEEEDGKLIYSLVYQIPGKKGVEEVAVDALTGKVLGVEHETPESIAKEKKADSVAAAKAKAKGRGGE
jgi:peptidase YpeB-like protein